MYNIIDMSGHDNATTENVEKAASFIRETLAKEGKAISAVLIEYDDSEQIAKVRVYPRYSTIARYEIVRAKKI